jgi:type IV fimbrial biogenesis protein FimT
MRKLSRSSGVTLLELVVVVAIVAVLVTLAVPSFTSMAERSAVSGHVNTFIGALRFARSEAIKAGTTVVMCRSSNSETATPTCATSGNDWMAGWIVFVNRDQDASNNFNSADGDSLLKAQGPMQSSGGIVPAATVGKFVFRSTGIMSAGASQMVFNSKSLASTRQKIVCVSFQGRARVLVDSFSNCSTSNDS